MVGDVKGGAIDRKSFPEAAIGHILDMGRDLLKEVQFMRNSLICFLTDGNRFQFFKCERRGGGLFEFFESGVYVGVPGWQVLSTRLLQCVPSCSVLIDILWFTHDSLRKFGPYFT
jgi:hypothetical protein